MSRFFFDSAKRSSETPEKYAHMLCPLAWTDFTDFRWYYPGFVCLSVEKYPTGIVDGDTVIGTFDRGMKDWRVEERLRLFGVAAPEVRGEDKVAGQKARDHLEFLVYDLLDDFNNCVFRTQKDRDGTDKKGSFGRYLVEIWTPDGTECLNARMVTDGYADWY